MNRTGFFRRFRGEIRAFALCCLLGALSMAVFAFRNQGFFYVLSDFNTQQIPFTVSLHQYLESSPVGGWIWNYELGHSAVQAYSFYALGSPFFWLTMLFPAAWFPYIVSFIYVLKYGVAGFTACLFLKRFAGHRDHALIGAVMYAFSGFQTVNLQFYHFHDVVALFPLLLTALEILIRRPRRYLPFVFAVFVTCLVNYFFFVAEAVFAVLYYIFRVPKKNHLRSFLKTGCICLLCGLWGIAMAAVLFVPNVLYMLGHSRMAAEQLTLRGALPLPGWSMYVLKGFLFPGEGMYQQSSIMFENYDSVSVWLPVVGSSLCFAYVLRERKWLSGLLLLLAAASFIPLLSSAFSLFTRNYYRWWFMLSLLMALASVKVMDNPSRYPVRLSVALHFAAVILLFILLHLLQRFTAKEYIFHEDRLILYAGLACACYAAAFFLFGKQGVRVRLLLFSVCVMAVASTCLSLYFSRSYENGERDRVSFRIGQSLEPIDGQYRYNLTNNAQMLCGGGSGMTVFSSTTSRGTREFESLFGFSSTNSSLNKNQYPGLPELFAARYRVTANPGSARVLRQFRVEDTDYYVTERLACPIGYRAENYILPEDLLRLPAEQRGIALLRAPLVRPEDEAAVSSLAVRLSAEDLAASPAIPGLVRRNASGAVRDFSRDGNGFRCAAAYPADSLVYFSVPFDSGWEARIDDQPAAVMDSGGMMLLPVPAGDHRIEFRYRTPGYRVGRIVSLAAVSAFLLCLVFRLISKKRARS